MSDIEMKAKFRDWFTTKAPKQFKEMFDKTTVDEGILLEVCFHQFAEMVANDAIASDKQCNLLVVSQRSELLAFLDHYYSNGNYYKMPREAAVDAYLKANCG